MTTVGMNYRVRPGKEHAFEAKFTQILEALQAVPGHGETRLYRNVLESRSYLIVSEWTERAAFDAFVASETFRKVTSWGAENILEGRPRHDVYDHQGPITTGKT